MPVAIVHLNSPGLPARPAGQGLHPADAQAGPEHRDEQLRQPVREPVRQPRDRAQVGHPRPNPNSRCATRRICISSEPSVIR